MIEEAIDSLADARRADSIRLTAPHHFINADGTCHAGDLFEHGTHSTGVYLAEQVKELILEEREVRARLVLLVEWHMAEADKWRALYEARVNGSVSATYSALGAHTAVATAKHADNKCHCGHEWLRHVPEVGGCFCNLLPKQFYASPHIQKR